MQYRIEYSGGRFSDYFRNREDLVKYLKTGNYPEIRDIRKIYKTCVSDSVIEKYTAFIKK